MFLKNIKKFLKNDSEFIPANLKAEIDKYFIEYIKKGTLHDVYNSCHRINKNVYEEFDYFLDNGGPLKNGNEESLNAFRKLRKYLSNRLLENDMEYLFMALDDKIHSELLIKNIKFLVDRHLEILKKSTVNYELITKKEIVEIRKSILNNANENLERANFLLFIALGVK